MTGAVWSTDRISIRIDDIVAVVRDENPKRILVYMRGGEHYFTCNFATEQIRDGAFEKLTQALYGER